MSSRSHAPSLIRRIEGTLKREIQIEKGAKIAVAVSGGPDSLALAHALCHLRESLSLQLLVVSIDHGLRPEALEEVELVRRMCLDNELAFATAQLGMKPGGNLQERARNARYETLWSLVDEHLGADAFLATAHHADDRAETVLLRLLRGSSLEGMNVLGPRTGRLIRPMIRASRDDVEAHVSRHGLAVVRDPSNEDVRYLRVRVRLELLPLLKRLSPNIVGNLVEIADDAMRLEEPLGLNREQRAQLRAALRERKNPVNLLMPGGLRLIRDLTQSSSE